MKNLLSYLLLIAVIVLGVMFYVTPDIGQPEPEPEQVELSVNVLDYLPEEMIHKYIMMGAGEREAIREHILEDLELPWLVEPDWIERLHQAQKYN